jgi:23S rRNA (cytosine1962-C5)-methyltransferase
MTSSFPIVRLKANKHAHVRNFHHSIFASAVLAPPQVVDGGIVEVQSLDGDFLCYALWNSKAYIVGRAISFEKGDPLKVIERRIEESIRMRSFLLKDEDTTAFRLINAEGDQLPGLIVDQYADVLVVQFTTLGMDSLREWIIPLLLEHTKLSFVFEKSAGAGRKKEGLEPREGWIGTVGPQSTEIRERGVRYIIDFEGSQKTGFFLDQRELRSMVRSLSKGRRVLDCCSYVGGFSVNALLGGALHTDAVDYDRVAVARALEHVKLNGVEESRFGSYSEDVFHFLHRDSLPQPYDFIVLDPPAFAKKSTDLDQAKHAYTDLNRLALDVLPSGGLLLTCSCSYQMDTALFQTVVFHAARQAKRSVRIIQRHRLAVDHPVNLFHPETEYLKSMLLWVE